MNKIILLISVFACSICVNAQKKDAYIIYKSNGKKTSYKRMLKKIPKAEVLLFGEFHNNPIAHWLQLEIAVDLHEKGNQLSFGAEMFEADQQNTIDQYLNGQINQEEFKNQMRLWPNYATDYQPLLEWAKDNNYSFTATNIPRPFASKVYKEGGFKALEELSEVEKAWVAPLPIPYDPELKTYKNMLAMMGGEHANPDIVKAQASKDATMAHFILENRVPNTLFFHLNGSYHSNFYEGIVWYLKQYNPDLKVVTLTTVEQEDIYKLEEEFEGIADYIICVPSTMTKTY